MALFRMRLKFQQSTLLGADDVQWSFGLEGDTPPTALAMGAWIEEFQLAISAAVGGIVPKNLFQQGMLFTALECYPAAGGEALEVVPVSPAYAIGAGGQCPSEVALCVSYQVDTVRGEKPKGRTYLGPFGSQFIDATSLRPAATDLTALITFWKTFLDHVNESEWEVAVINAEGTVGWPVRSLMMDNAWDTQRRRGVVASSRTVLALAP